MSNNNYYVEQRAKLISELYFLRTHRCPLAAKARIRKIAELDYQNEGIPKKDTYNLFHYYSIK